MTNNKIVETVIKDTLQKRGLDYEHICKELGIPKFSFSQCMKGKRRLNAGEFISLCTFLNLTVEDFK